MSFFRKEKNFTIREMIAMENELKCSALFTMNLHADDKDLFKKLQLKVEYVDGMEDDNEAELMPVNDGTHLGLIRLRRELKKYRFAYIHEIIHYIFDVGYGKKVTKTFTRKRKGKTDSSDEQKINYKTAAYIMPYSQILDALEMYDSSNPKMDELKFVRGLQKHYEQNETAVIRRIREVRSLKKSGYMDP